DGHVTGVQTCALPISHQDGRAPAQRGSLGPTRLEQRQPGPAKNHEQRGRAGTSLVHGAPHVKPAGGVLLRFPIRSSTLPLNSVPCVTVARSPGPSAGDVTVTIRLPNCAWAGCGASKPQPTIVA